MEKSGFFNAMKVDGEWDRIYKAENFAEYFATFIGNGVFPNPASQLQVKETDKMQIVIKPGKAWINGFIYINTDDLILDVDVADGVLNRIDKVVLRYDVAKREIRAVVKKGQYASNPVVPEVTRNADMYEIALADIKVNAGAIKISQSDITDLRLNKEMCGIVHGTVDQVDTTAIFNQFQSWYSQTKDNYDKDISKWTKEKKETFNNWYSTNTQAFLKQFSDWYGTNTKQWTNDFNTWFSTIKGQLDGDIAAKLTNKTIELEDKINTLTADDITVTEIGKTVSEVVLDNLANTEEMSHTISSVESQLADMTKQIENIDLNADKVTLSSNKFKSKNVKGALEEVFTFASNGKEKIAIAITGKGVNASSGDTFSVLATKIGQISTGKKWARGTVPKENVKIYNNNSSSYKRQYIEITNLNFKPSFIFVMPKYFEKYQPCWASYFINDTLFTQIYDTRLYSRIDDISSKTISNVDYGKFKKEFAYHDTILDVFWMAIE